ncbi:hypothetical protein [Pseudoalteromonas sp. TAB23]|nr:hypothetical protein [Pseudoalteromonas sp. TAB23]
MVNVFHLYDESTGKLYLENGREFLINPNHFASVDQALVAISAWAKKTI